MSDDSLPRIRVNLHTGDEALEYQLLFDNHVACTDRRLIVGCYTTPIVRDGKVVRENGVALQIFGGGTMLTDHSYEDMVNVLYPGTRGETW